MLIRAGYRVTNLATVGAQAFRQVQATETQKNPKIQFVINDELSMSSRKTVEPIGLAEELAENIFDRKYAALRLAECKDQRVLEQDSNVC